MDMVQTHLAISTILLSHFPKILTITIPLSDCLVTERRFYIMSNVYANNRSLAMLTGKNASQYIRR